MEASFAADARDALVAALSGLLEQHCQQLGDLVDSRLAAHHRDLLRLLSEELQPERSSGKLAAKTSARGAATPAARGSQGSVAAALEAAASKTEAKQEAQPCEMAPGDEEAVPVSAGEHDTEVAPVEEVCDKPPTLRMGRTSTMLLTASTSTDQFTFEETERMRKKTSRQTTVGSLYQAMTGGLERKSWRTHHLRRFVESQFFETLLCVLIVSNACFFGFEVQSNMGLPEEAVPVYFKVVEYFYTGSFLLELVLRLLAHGVIQFFCGTDCSWNILDCLLVMISVLELCLELHTSGGTGTFDFTYVRIIRVAKTVRIFRVVRILKFFRPLRILLCSVLNTVRSLVWIIILLTLVIYIFGVVFTTASSQALASGSCSDPALLVEYFGSLWLSISSLFQSITGGMDWQTSANALSTLDPVWVALFIFFIAFSQFALLQVVTGLVCQTAMESAQQDEDIVVQAQLAVKQKYVSQLENLFKDLDSDSTGKITLRKFESRLQDSRLKAYLDALDLTTEEAWSLFKLLDTQGTRMIDVDDFVSGCLKLRGTARSLDIHMLMYESRWTMNKLTKIMKVVQDLSSSLCEVQKQLPCTLPPQVADTNSDSSAPAGEHRGATSALTYWRV